MDPPIMAAGKLATPTCCSMATAGAGLPAALLKAAATLPAAGGGYCRTTALPKFIRASAPIPGSVKQDVAAKDGSRRRYK